MHRWAEVKMHHGGLLFFVCLAVLAQELPKPAHMLLQAAIGHVAAVAGKNFWLRQIGGRSVFVRISENEFARLERRTGPGRGHFAGAFDDRLREPVAVAEVVVCVVERWRRLQVQRREHLHALALCDEPVVLVLAALALSSVAGKQNDDGVKVRAGEATYPVVRMILSGVAEHRLHTLPR